LRIEDEGFEDWASAAILNPITKFGVVALGAYDRNWNLEDDEEEERD
jgi:hypothetical protein